MKIFIKNMVCNRCVLVIKNTLENIGYSSGLVSMGEVDFENQTLNKTELDQIQQAIEPLGFELISDKKQALIERVKTSLIELTNGDTVLDDFKLSDFITAQLKQDYHSLSHLFSSVEGITIEKYFIQLKVERIKELLVYDELSQSEIAWRLGYSSPAHLSAQFKQITGMTPSAFKKLKDNKQRRPLDKI
jgi:AraC-like DNA-binding protein